jgi:hypothetical protein
MTRTIENKRQRAHKPTTVRGGRKLSSLRMRRTVRDRRRRRPSGTDLRKWLIPMAGRNAGNEAAERDPDNDHER